MNKWEYHIHTADDPLNAQLDELGKDGWELVSTMVHGRMHYGERAVNEYIFFFKRPTGHDGALFDLRGLRELEVASEN